MSNWYLKQENEIQGPFSPQEIKDLALDGKISKLDLVRQGSNGEFTLLTQTPLFSILEPISKDATVSKKPAILYSLGIICVFLFVTVQIVIQIYPPRMSGRPRSVTITNLKQIGLALHNYHEKHTTFPPGAIISASGKPFHSWQTLILPYLEQSALHHKVDFNKPWDDPVNQSVFKQKIVYYLKPTIKTWRSPDGYALSHYVGNDLLLKKNRSMIFQDITDGTSNTIVAVEIGANFKAWGDPTNIENPVNLIGVGKNSHTPGGNHILLVDGSVSFVSETIDPQILKALSTPDGGEKIDEF